MVDQRATNYRKGFCSSALKDEDGPQIAANMSKPPADLASIIDAFLSDEN